LQVDASRPTTVKMRLLAQNQQIVRLDREIRIPITAALETTLLTWVEKNLPGTAACILSDYGKGVLTARVAETAIALCRSAGVPALVDPKSLDVRTCRGATVVKPNRHEAERLALREIDDEPGFLEVGRHLTTLL